MTYEPDQTVTCSMCDNEVPESTATPWATNSDLAQYDPSTMWLCDECAEEMSEPCDTCGNPVLPVVAISSNNDRSAPWVCDECAVKCECGVFTSPAVAVAVDGDNAAPWLCPACVKSDLKQAADDAAIAARKESEERAESESEDDDLHM